MEIKTKLLADEQKAKWLLIDFAQAEPGPEELHRVESTAGRMLDKLRSYLTDEHIAAAVRQTFGTEERDGSCRFNLKPDEDRFDPLTDAEALSLFEQFRAALEPDAQAEGDVGKAKRDAVQADTARGRPETRTIVGHKYGQPVYGRGH